MSGRVECQRGYGTVQFSTFSHPAGAGLKAWWDETCPVSGAVRCRECMIQNAGGNMSIGGSMFVHNALRYDYCMEEAILSLLAFCDQVVVLDCQSDDGTLAALNKMAERYKALQVQGNGEWTCAPGRERLAILANQARAHLTTQYHFMLQADEVVHEASIPFIKQAVASKSAPGYHCRRWNLYGDADHCIRLDSTSKPCGDDPVRLGNLNLLAVGDAEGLDSGGCSPEFVKDIVIVHYGLVRRGSSLIDKCMDMQSWFFGGHDPRTVQAKEDGVFYATDFTPESEYMALPCSHPVYMNKWLAERKDDPTRRFKRC